MVLRVRQHDYPCRYPDNYLLVLCFVAGLLGGFVYVNAFTLISREVAPPLVELSLTATSVADTLGILAADLTGLVIQKALYQSNGISD